ncbi:MAG: hypothetical protein ACK5N0_11005 [Synechococcaceae cyanobacterium]
MLALADRSADWVDQALRDLDQAEQSMQAACHYPEGTPGEHYCCAEA